MTKNADFGPNLAVFWPNILIFMEVSESFGTNITENFLINLITLFFGQALDQMGQKCRYLAQNASFGPNLVVFGTKNHLGNLSALFFGWAWDQMGQKGRYSAKNVSFGQNLAIFVPKINFWGG